MRERLVSFLAAGALLFVLWQASVASGARVVTLDAALLSAMQHQQAALLGRELFALERDALRERYVEDELLLHEAVRRGLHLADAMTRARLVQLMRAEVAAPPPAPTRAELERWLEENFERFASAEAITLEHVPFAPEEPVTDEDLRSVLAELRAGADPASFGTSGFAAPRQLVRKSRRELGETLGEQFAERVQALSQGEWSGPIESPYARHLVRVVERHARDLPTFDAIENYVRAQWYSEHRPAAARQRMDALRAVYQFQWASE